MEMVNEPNLWFKDARASGAAFLGEQHSFMYHLESFFGVLFCIHSNEGGMLVQRVDKWNYADTDEPKSNLVTKAYPLLRTTYLLFNGLTSCGSSHRNEKT